MLLFVAWSTFNGLIAIDGSFLNHFLFEFDSLLLWKDWCAEDSEFPSEITSMWL